MEALRDRNLRDITGQDHSPPRRVPRSWILRFEAMKDEEMRVKVVDLFQWPVPVLGLPKPGLGQVVIFIVRSTIFAGIALLLTEFVLAVKKVHDLRASFDASLPYELVKHVLFLE
jgi:hypothetical protein